MRFGALSLAGASFLGCCLFNQPPSPPTPRCPWRGPTRSRAGVVVGFCFTGVIELTHILPAPARPGSHPRAAGINGFTLPCLAGNGLRKRVSLCHPKPAAARRARSRWQPRVPLARGTMLAGSVCPGGPDLGSPAPLRARMHPRPATSPCPFSPLPKEVEKCTKNLSMRVENPG